METKTMQTITMEGKEIPVIDSREVAEMLSVKHCELLRKIDGGSKEVGIIPTLENGNFPLSNYFIESSYKAGKNQKTYKCYLCTKMGCELLGNKQQGEKGILFSAEYVKRFNQYEEALKEMQQPKQMSENEIIAKALLLVNKKYEHVKEELKQVTFELNEKKDFIDDINDCFTFTQISQFNKQLLRDRKDIVLNTATLNKVAAELNIPINKIENPIVYSPYRRVNAYPRKVWEKAYPDLKLPDKKCDKECK